MKKFSKELFIMNFHIIHKNFESHFNEVIWGKFNNSEFKYSQCSTCKKLD